MCVGPLTNKPANLIGYRGTRMRTQGRSVGIRPSNNNTRQHTQTEGGLIRRWFVWQSICYTQDARYLDHNKRERETELLKTRSKVSACVNIKTVIFSSKASCYFGTYSWLQGNSLPCHALATVPIMHKINEARYFIHTSIHLRVLL